MKVKLTEINIPSLEGRFAGPDRDKADAVYWDTEIIGFGLRFRRSGKRTWVLQYKYKGSDRRMTLGPYPGVTAKKARGLAQAALGDKWHGKDPQADRRAAKAKLQAQTTLLEVIDLYLLDKKPELRPISFYETERYLRKNWRSLHSRPIKEIERSEVAKILDQLKHASGKTAAARARGSLSALFGWAMERGHADANPVIGTANSDPHTQGERVLKDGELAAVWKACDGDNDYDRIIRILILTGCRRSEVGGMRWSEFNDDRTAWTIPADRTKNGKAYTLPLPDMFWNIIDDIKPRNGSDHLFGYSDRGFRNWNNTKKALDKKSGVVNWKHHDLRRTFCTGLGKLGILPHIAELCINHSKGGLIAVYDKHLYEGEIAAALMRWARYVALAIDPDLLAAHKAYLARGDEDARKQACAEFNGAVAQGSQGNCDWRGEQRYAIPASSRISQEPSGHDSDTSHHRDRRRVAGVAMGDAGHNPAVADHEPA